MVRRFDGVRSLPAAMRPSLVAIGNFDGVHLGHQAVLAAASALGRERLLAPLVLTFDPHPAEVLGRAGARKALTTLERKIELLCRIDPALAVVVERFDAALARKTPREFAADLLVGGLGAAVVLVGENFRFGHGRAGDLATLRALGEELGFEARSEALATDAGGAISSTRIRDALARGDVESAQRLLGRPHALCGRVVEGDRRGRTLGFPTANLDGVREALPPNGVYATLVDRVDAEPRRLAAGVANLGVRPTVAGGFSVEVHLLDFSGDLYGAVLRLHLVARLREERRFAGLDELKVRIAEDVRRAREALAGRAPDPAAGAAWF